MNARAQRTWCCGLGRRIAAARVAAGVTQPQLARAVDVHRQTAYRWEAGELLPSALQLARLADALRVRPATLLPPLAPKRRRARRAAAATTKTTEPAAADTSSAGTGS